jgi:hypothetical protein
MGLAMTLTLRRANNDPPSYRVNYDGVEIGSISKQYHHIEHRDFLAWGIDMMPVMSHGGRPPYGKAQLQSGQEAVRGSLRELEGWAAARPVRRELHLQAGGCFPLGQTMNWSRRFDDPVPMPDGSTICTIGQAAEYATSLPRKVGSTEPWQIAARVLNQAAEHGGPFMFMATDLLLRS